MATYLKFDDFTENMAEGVHTLNSEQLIIGLTTDANQPGASDSVILDLTQINYANLSSRDITTTSSGQSPAGTYNLILSDVILTASGAVATFRWVFIYNDTPTSPADPLIAFYDHGSNVTLATDETFTIDFPVGAWFSNV